MKTPIALLWGAAVGSLLACAQAAATSRTVVELFTSQGCSSCPPADAIAGRLRTDPGIIVLSFHVNYWDGPQWKDPFSLQSSTDRQYVYGRALQESSVFTPQVIVGGTRSVIGSQDAAILRAIRSAQREESGVQVDLARRPDNRFQVTVRGAPTVADMWEVEYIRHSATSIRGGENGGRTLDTYNDVTRIRRLAAVPDGTSILGALERAEDGIAVIVQLPRGGKILGGAAYELQ